jgi:hypothetical protein
MNMLALFFPQNNDIVVTAKFPEITDGTGVTSEFWYKDDKTTPDSDPTSLSYQSTLVHGADNVWYAQFNIPATDTGVPGAYWWRVDAIDTSHRRMTANCGTLLVEAV